MSVESEVELTVESPMEEVVLAELMAESGGFQ